MTGFESFIGLNPWTALFTLINLVITFLILKKFLFKPVKKMIDDRQKEIDDTYQAADTAKAEAEALRSDYHSRLSNAKTEAAGIIQSATVDAQQRGEQIVRQARQDADQLREKANADIARERRKALNEVKDDISTIAVDIAEKVVKKELNAKDQQALIEQFIQEMGESK